MGDDDLVRLANEISALGGRPTRFVVTNPTAIRWIYKTRRWLMRHARMVRKRRRGWA